MKTNWRKEYPALVAEAHTLGSIAVIRSLGRAGYPVHSYSSKPAALGFGSKFSSSHVVAPHYSETNFIEWLRAYVQANQIQAIVPSEGLLLAIRPHFQEFSRLLPYSSSESVVYAGMSKADQITTFALEPGINGTGSHLPPFLLFRESQQIPDAKDLARLGLPVYMKVDGCYAKNGDGSAVHKATTAEQARKKIAAIVSRYTRILIEGHVPGQGVGAFFLLWDHQVRAEFMHIRLHEVPHTGGVSSYRSSWWHEKVRSDALVKLKAMNWQGVAMMEYRWDSASDEFYFLEMNGRFWGSLHLALYAGVDFPLLLLDSFHGRGVEGEKRPARNVSCRYTFPGDVAYVWSRWKDPAVKWPSKLATLLGFLALCLNPRVYSDLWFPGDRRLYWQEFKRFLKDVRDNYFRERMANL